MIVSEARREANRRNALPSRGPRTEAGKERLGRDALAHALSAEVVKHPEDGPAGAEPVLDWTGFLVEQVTAIASKLRRCDRLERRYRDRVALRAESFWDDDRRLEAEFLGSGIARDPAAIARALRTSPHGCDWLIERWSLLARAADRDGAWTADQRALAFDLLGTPSGLRGGSPGEAIDPEGRPTLADPGLRGLARREIADLLRRKAEVAPLDALDRAGARTDPDSGDDPELRKLRRHEAELHRRLRWCVAQIEKFATPPDPTPAPPSPPRRHPVEDQDHDFDPAALLETMMAQADALRRLESARQADDLRPPRPASPRPDPRAARDKAREAARQSKRDRRRA